MYCQLHDLQNVLPIRLVYFVRSCALALSAHYYWVVWQYCCVGAWALHGRRCRDSHCGQSRACEHNPPFCRLQWQHVVWCLRQRTLWNGGSISTYRPPNRSHIAAATVSIQSTNEFHFLLTVDFPFFFTNCWTMSTCRIKEWALLMSKFRRNIISFVQLLFYLFCYSADLIRVLDLLSRYCLYGFFQFLCSLFIIIIIVVQIIRKISWYSQ